MTEEELLVLTDAIGERDLKGPMGTIWQTLLVTYDEIIDSTPGGKDTDYVGVYMEQLTSDQRSKIMILDSALDNLERAVKEWRSRIKTATVDGITDFIKLESKHSGKGINPSIQLFQTKEDSPIHREIRDELLARLGYLRCRGNDKLTDIAPDIRWLYGIFSDERNFDYTFLRASQISPEQYREEKLSRDMLLSGRAVKTDTNKGKFMLLPSDRPEMNRVFAETTYRVPCELSFHFSTDTIIRSL